MYHTWIPCLLSVGSFLANTRDLWLYVCTFRCLKGCCEFKLAFLLSELGTTNLSCLSSKSSQTKISPLMFQYSRSSGSTWYLLFGHTLITVLLTFCNVRSFLVASLHCSNFYSLTGMFSMMSTSNSSFVLAAVSALSSGVRFRVSAINKFLPGSYSTCRS